MSGIPVGLASVIVPCFNQLEFTRQCVTALVRYTRPPWELIVVDDGSTDGTASYLAGSQDVSPIPVTVVTNPTNRGYAAAVNQWPAHLVLPADPGIAASPPPPLRRANISVRWSDVTVRHTGYTDRALRHAS